MSKEGESEGKPDLFDTFWKLYPNKQKKPKALAAWRRLRQSEQPAVITGLRIWVSSDQWAKDNGQFIPHPTTFLNERRWEDMPLSRQSSKLDEEYEEVQRMLAQRKAQNA